MLGGVVLLEREATMSWCRPVLKKRETNETCNPGEVQIHMWEAEAAEVEEQDWGV